MLVDESIAQRLENRAVADVTNRSGKHLRLQFPITEMAQDENDGPSAAQLTMGGIRILDLDSRPNFFQRHNT